VIADIAWLPPFAIILCGLYRYGGAGDYSDNLSQPTKPPLRS